jgi:diguanylate cyclase (GGDEF)-like protein
MGLWARPRRVERDAELEGLRRENESLRVRLAAALDAADHDALTPALNRRAFMRELHRSLSVLERYERSAAVVYIDLDGMKAFNDRFGHATGDAALRHVARVLTDSVRESDVVGRLGGDEFGVILNEVEALEARRKAAALAAQVETRLFVHEGQSHRVAISYGVHLIARPEDPETVLARADEAMYADKHARRLGARIFDAF